MIRRLADWVLLAPVQAALALLLGATELLRALTLPRRRHREAGPPLESPLCSLVVLNWNGRALLEESLPLLLAAVRHSGRPHEVLIVDNGSEDDSVAWLRRHHPEVRLLELERNLGFGEGNNRGVEAARHEVVVLLNNDMLVAQDFLGPLLAAFADPRVFAASSQIEFPPGRRREETGNTRGRMRKGRLELSHEPLRSWHQARTAWPVWWAGGGSSAYRRQRFLELGGFAPLFSPCYLEDTDLSYRAWRRGWHSVVCPASRVLHKHRSSTARRYSAGRLNTLLAQRRLWYAWRNFPLRALAGHLLLFPLHLRKELGGRDYLRALWALPRVLRARLREPARVVSHARLSRWVADPLLYLNRFHPRRHRGSKSSDGRPRLLVLSAYLPHLGKHGGAGRVFQLLSRAAQTMEVTLVSFVESPEEAREVSQAAPYCRRVETVLRRRFEPVSPFPYEPFEEFNCANFREMLREVLLEDDFDVVHYEWTQMAMYAGMLPPIPSLLTEIEVNYAAHYSLVPLEARLPAKVHLYYRTLQTLYRELQLCGRVDRVVCVTDADREFLDGYVEPGKLAVVHTGVDTNYFRPAEPGLREADSLVYVGAFRHDPNVDAMRYFCSEIFPRILRERPQTRLYVVGSSPPREIRRLARNPAITVTGFVDDIREYYWRAQVVVVPLRTGVGIRGKILEGWAAGNAMVATSLACLGIRAEHGENILIADDPDEFARWTLALLAHPEHCERLGRAGRRLAQQHYEWDQLGRRMTRTYLDLLPEGTPRPTLREALP